MSLIEKCVKGRNFRRTRLQKCKTRSSRLMNLELFKYHTTFGLLICTLISENQGLENSRSASKLRKITGPANLDFFLEKS